MHAIPSPYARRGRPASALASLQRRMMLLSTGVATAWLWGAWAWSPFWAVTGLVLMGWGHSAVLAVEFFWSARINRSDSVPQASRAQLFEAWREEATLTPTIFFWRQPFLWRALPDSAPGDSASITGASAAVLVHGFVCNRGFWAPWMQAMRHAGVPYTSVNLEPVFGSIDDGVALIEEAVAQAERLGAEPPVLVCHSMGGLAARAWLASAPGNLARVGRVITIGSPHHGTWLARWSRVTNGRQMRQHSEWLRALAARETEWHGERAYSKFVCWYSNADHIVFPASTAMLPGAEHRHVPGMAHVALGFHPTVMGESLAMLVPASTSVEARTAS